MKCEISTVVEWRQRKIPLSVVLGGKQAWIEAQVNVALSFDFDIFKTLKSGFGDA